MPFVISLAALKGGVGKSTLAINLAAQLHTNGKRTIIVDADSQATCRGWAQIAAAADRDTPPVVGMGAELRRDLKRVAKGFDFAVVDTPPRLGAEQRAAMLVSDLVLIPVTPGPADVWALQETLALLDDARELRPEIRAAIILNRVNARTCIAEATRQAIESSDMRRLRTTVGSRVAFGEAMAAGQGVATFAPGSSAADEVDELEDEILEILGAQS